MLRFKKKTVIYSTVIILLMFFLSAYTIHAKFTNNIKLAKTKHTKTEPEIEENIQSVASDTSNATDTVTAGTTEPQSKTETNQATAEEDTSPESEPKTETSTKPAEKPKVTPPASTTPFTVVPESEQEPTPPTTSPVYNFVGIDPAKIIENSSNYTVKINNLNPVVGENVKFTVEPLGKFSAYIIRAEVYGNGMMYGGSNGQWLNNKNNVYMDTIVVQNWAPQENNTVESYIFIEPRGDDKIYQYKNILHIQSTQSTP